MIHLLAVLLGAGLMLAAALQVATGASLGRGEVGAAHIRFILSGLMLIASTSAVPLLGDVFRAWSVHQDLSAVAAAVSVAIVIAASLPHDPEDYRRLMYGTTPPALPGTF